ncbi:cyclophilin-like fold protein [Curtobacterium sp. MCBD17_003]|uniref:cyclophilin-like fold protein n=1 Tax=Curtobacterium sp. MCBD17_003 TaxID=2175667 RepID=UPI000DA7B200|nr:cyclophilin-like fold protein [Curtobacterium sp. MCBD17_003]WIE54764.1 cyclophilin-like fold protein [Curtobacterium sp. MCBD17_003]
MTTPIQIRIGDTVINGSLNDTAPAQALLSRLPLTLNFEDLNGEEKIGHLDQELPMTGMPASDDPFPGDIGYYAPWGNVVFYYGDVSRYDGIARIGTLEQTAPIQRHDGDFSATIQRAN